MALDSFLKIVSNTKGHIKGSVKLKGKENLIRIVAAQHEIVSPRDAASGLATGKRQHKPFVITKEIDKSSPLLYQVLITNDTITEFKLDFYAKPATGVSGGAGKEVLVYSIILTTASIASIQLIKPDVRNPDFVKYAEYEEIAFTYQKIEWIWKDGNISASDEAM